MKKYAILAASVLFATLLHCTLCVAQNTRYFKADHGVAATYVKLAAKSISAPATTRGSNVVHGDESPRHCYFDLGGRFHEGVLL